MRQPEFLRALRLILRELAEIIVKTIRAAPVEAGPECRFADGGASAGDHPDVIIRDAADHVCVGFDIAHGGSVVIQLAKSRCWVLDSGDWMGGCPLSSIRHPVSSISLFSSKACSFPGPRPAGGFARGGGDGIARGIAECEQHALCLVRLL